MALSLREGERERNRKRERDTVAHFRRDNEKVLRTRKRKDVNGEKRTKKKARGEWGGRCIGRRRKEDRIYSREWPVAVGPRVSRVTGG